MRLEPVGTVDLDSLKASVDLFGLVSHDTELRRESTTGGGSWAGACPVCGGVDRLVVRPNGDGEGRPPAWWCRKCHRSPGSAIDYVAWRDRLTFREAVAWLADRTVLADRGIVPPGTLTDTAARIAASEERERAERAAAAEHLSAAYREVELQAALRRHEDVVAALVAGGVCEAAIDRFGFGYATWAGRPALTIPWRVGDRLESVQYRLLDAESGDKYRWTKGTSGTLWNGAAVTAPEEDYVIVCEGAKKAAAVWSAGLFGVAAVPNNTSAARILGQYRDDLAHLDRVWVILDPDSPVEAQEAAAVVPGARVVDLPMKVDDWLVVNGCDAAALVRRLRGGRRAA